MCPTDQAAVNASALPAAQPKGDKKRVRNRNRKRRQKEIDARRRSRSDGATTDSTTSVISEHSDVDTNAGIKRTTTHIDAPSSPEQSTTKRSRPVTIQTDPSDSSGLEEKLDASEATLRKPTHRGKKAGIRRREIRERWKQEQAAKDLITRANAAKRILQILQQLEKIVLEKPVDSLSPEEAIQLADGHRVNKDENIYAFDAEKNAKEWREKTGVKPGQFNNCILTADDVEHYKFRIFTNGTIYAYEHKEDGDEELVFSAQFIPYDDMSEEELNDIKFLGKYFAERRDSGYSRITNNSAHKVKGAGGIMLGFGWRGGTDPGARAGTYVLGPDADWVLSHLKDRRMAAIYSRLYLRQAPKLHGCQTKFIKNNRLPRLDDPTLDLSEGVAPGSNLTCTCDDFCNGIHRDKDATRWTFGIWFPTLTDGSLVRDPNEVRRMTQGGQFVLPDHGIGVDFGACAGVVALTWRGPIDLHGTVKSTTAPGFVRWGTSIQCAERLRQRIALHYKAVDEQEKLGAKSKLKLLKINDWYERSGMPRNTNFDSFNHLYESLWDIEEDEDEDELIEMDSVPGPIDLDFLADQAGLTLDD